MSSANYKIIPIGVQHQQMPTPKRPPHVNRAMFIKWLRKLHGWIGLWGAALGLLFGITGIVLNHRTVLKIPVASTQERLIQLPLPNPEPVDAKALAIWLQQALAFDRPASRVRSEQQRIAAWGDKSIMQPEHWTVGFSSPRVNLQAEYWRGNNFVSIKRSDNNIFATLNSLHKGTGAGLGWVLLVDTLAGSIILLSLTGVLLWALQNRRRLVGAAIALGGLLVAAGFALQTL